MKYLFLLLPFLLIALIVYSCDWVFKHLLWHYMSRSSAVQVRWTVGIFIWAVVGLVVLHGNYYERYDLEVHEVEVPSNRLPAAFDGYRIAQISDLHLNTLPLERGKAFLHEAFDSIFAQRPDLIVFTGDLVSITAAEAEPFRAELAYLASKGIPVVSVLGNHDYADYAQGMTEEGRLQDRRKLRDLEKSCGWRLLNNEHLVLRRGNDSIALVGVENIGEPPFSTYGRLSQAMGGYAAADRTYTILLSHNPIHWRQEVLPKTHIDLTLSGHTHAMQFEILGWSPSSWRYREWGGLYTEAEQNLYVNTGMGTVGLPFRIGVGPEISLLVLKRSRQRKG